MNRSSKREKIEKWRETRGKSAVYGQNSNCPNFLWKHSPWYEEFRAPFIFIGTPIFAKICAAKVGEIVVPGYKDRSPIFAIFGVVNWWYTRPSHANSQARHQRKASAWISWTNNTLVELPSSLRGGSAHSLPSYEDGSSTNVCIIRPRNWLRRFHS